MSVLVTALKLVHSLSGVEKRQFKLECNKRKGDKDYLSLFEILDKAGSEDEDSLAGSFRSLHSEASVDSSARYLVKLLTDSLVNTRVEKDNYFLMLQSLMRVKVLQERSLPEEALRELGRLKQRAETTQNHVVHYLASRQELNYISASGFAGLSDEELMDRQMKTKSALRTLHHIEDHYSLYEQLRYRLIHSGRVASEEERKKLNDLLLSEVSLVAGKVKNSLESRKLHLLFQSFFFTDVGDFQSALKTFAELNRLFENNPEFREYPPMDYYASLDGMLDSLRTAGEFGAMQQYISKLDTIDLAGCPDYFLRMVRKTITVYTLALLTGENRYEEAIALTHSLDKDILKSMRLVHDEKQWELYFYVSLAHFSRGEYKKAHQWIQRVSLEQSRFALLPVCKAIRLLNIIIHYELKDSTFLSYEIRSYKRFFQRKTPLSKTEKMIFKTIQLDPNSHSSIKNRLLAPQATKYIQQILSDKYEKQLLKYFRFDRWVLKKFQVQG